MDGLIRIAISLAALEVAFSVLQVISPGVRGQRMLREGWRTDVVYWFVTPLVTRPLTGLLIRLAIFPLLLVLGASAQGGYHGFGPIAAQPAWLQALEMIVFGDFVGYWTHRWFHTGRLWPFHAVHHSSTQVDWLSSVRLHPVNDLLSRAAQAAALLLLGFSPGFLAAYLPFLTIYAVLLHANVSWDFGPLRLVLASPTFHRWHHSDEPAAVNKNLAGLLPAWDLLFRTLYMPANNRPVSFGLLGSPLPTGFVGLMLQPFRTTRTLQAA